MSNVLDLLDDEATADERQQMRDIVAMVSSLPQRTKVLKDLVDSLHKCIGIEREAVGLDTAAGTDGRPMVIIRDFTGRGDPDAPVRPEGAA